jgi:hypothetical protein
MTGHEIWLQLLTMISTIAGIFLAQALYWRWKGHAKAPQDVALLQLDHENLKKRFDELEEARRIDATRIEALRISHAALKAFLTKKLNGEVT